LKEFAVVTEKRYSLRSNEMQTLQRFGDNGVVNVPKHSEPGARMPTSTTIKLARPAFEACYWITRVEGITAAQLVDETCGLQWAARMEKYKSEIEKLKKLDEQTAKVEQAARQRAGE
jgi:hypothetical protein